MCVAFSKAATETSVVCRHFSGASGHLYGALELGTAMCRDQYEPADRKQLFLSPDINKCPFCMRKIRDTY